MKPHDTKNDPTLTPRKVPKQSRAEHTVATILEACALILESVGLEGLNTNLVAQRAGVSIGSLYQYFPGKDALIVALSLRERALFFADAQGVRDMKTGVEAVQYLITVSVRQQLRRPKLARLLDFEEGRPAIAKALEDNSGVMLELVNDLFAYEDLPKQQNRHEAAHDMFAIVRGMVDAAGSRGEIDALALERRVRRAVFGYLGMTLTVGTGATNSGNTAGTPIRKTRKM